jgi:hypothetical protein
MVNRILKILKEYNEEEEDIFTKDMFSEVHYKNLFKVFDKNPDNIFKLLNSLELGNFDNRFEIESNLIYRYLTEYKDRTDYYIDVTFTPDEIANNFFCDDREYDIREMVEGYLRSDWDYGYHYECYDFDDYYFNRIDQQNLDALKEIYLENLEGESSEEGFKEFVEEEFGSDIGCAASDAQHSADIDALHSEFNDKIEEHFSNLNGQLQPPVDKEGNKGFGLEYVGSVEIGELVNGERFKEVLLDHLEHGYPESFSEILNHLLDDEMRGYLEQYNYFLPDECITINTDRHFRYGGAGDIDWSYFNEILSDRISHY